MLLGSRPNKFLLRPMPWNLPLHSSSSWQLENLWSRVCMWVCVRQGLNFFLLHESCLVVSTIYLVAVYSLLCSYYLCCRSARYTNNVWVYLCLLHHVMPGWWCFDFYGYSVYRLLKLSSTMSSGLFILFMIALAMWDLCFSLWVYLSVKNLTRVFIEITSGV